MPIIAHAREIVDIVSVEDRLRAGGRASWSAEELRYAESKSDPARRLAARWAAKLAAARALGGNVRPEDIEILREHGAPYVRLGPTAEARRVALGSPRVLVSLTHGVTHAAASIVLETAS